MTRIKNLRKILGYTQDRLAKLLGVSRSTVAMWETSTQTPDYPTLKRIQLLFNVPENYIMNEGVFKDWDRIITEFEPIEHEFLRTIPRNLFLPNFCDEKTIVSWLYTRLYNEPDELQLARFFDFAVREIVWEVADNGDEPAVSITYTPEFEAIMNAANTRTEDEFGWEKTPRKGIKVPVYRAVAAGIPIEAIEDIVDYEEIEPELAATGEFFGLRIKGSSMEPRICEGDVVIVRKQDDADTGDTAIVLVNGYEATCKRIKKDGHGIALIPNNPSYEVKYYSAEEISSLPVRIIGKVVELRGKF